MKMLTVGISVSPYTLPTEKYSPQVTRQLLNMEKLNEKFNCPDIRKEDKMCYLIQKLRADIQAEVLKKESKTYTEGEDTARRKLFHSTVHPSEKRRRCLTYCTGC